MYKITIGGVTVYDDTMVDDVSYQVTDYKLTMEDNKAGSLTVVIPPTNNGYGMMDSDYVRYPVKLYVNEEPIWFGRVTSVKMDFWNRAQAFCEGAMAWLADALYTGYPAEAGGGDSTKWASHCAKVKVKSVLRSFNMHCASEFEIGLGTVTMELYEFDSSGNTSAQMADTSKTCLQRLQDLQKTYGGHFQIESDDGDPVLSWYADIYGSSQDYQQTAKFGENLLNFAKTRSTEDVYTVIRPYGDLADNAPKTEQEVVTMYTSSSQWNDSKRLNKQGEVENTISDRFFVTDPIQIISGRKYYYSGRMSVNQGLFAVYDSQGVAMNVKSAYGGDDDTQAVTKVHNMVQIPLPDGAKTIVACFWQDTAYETEQSVDITEYSNVYWMNADTSVNQDEYRTTIDSVHDDDPTYVIWSLYNRFGWIEKRVNFTGINRPAGLLNAVERYADTVAFNLDSLSINFIDMAMVTGTSDPLKLYDGVLVVSEPHSTIVVMYVTKLELTINPANSKITLGISKEKGISALVGG